MLLSDFVTFDGVRATLGVSDEELTDATLQEEHLLASLRLDLQEISSGLISKYIELRDLETDLDDTSQAFFDTVVVFSTYAVSKYLLPGLPMFGPKAVTDGKAGITRFSDSPYKAVSAEIDARYRRFKTGLGLAYKALSQTSASSATARVLFSIGTPVYDPVAG